VLWPISTEPATELLLRYCYCLLLLANVALRDKLRDKFCKSQYSSHFPAKQAEKQALAQTGSHSNYRVVKVSQNEHEGVQSSFVQYTSGLKPTNQQNLWSSLKTGS
jgi:hypothetical protein